MAKTRRAGGVKSPGNESWERKKMLDETSQAKDQKQSKCLLFTIKSPPEQHSFIDYYE